jgi:hypothetical protein
MPRPATQRPHHCNALLLLMLLGATAPAVAQESVADIQDNARFLFYAKKTLGDARGAAPAFGLRVEQPWRRERLQPQGGDLAGFTFLPVVDVAVDGRQRYAVQVLDRPVLDGAAPDLLDRGERFVPRLGRREEVAAPACALDDWPCRFADARVRSVLPF